MEYKIHIESTQALNCEIWKTWHSSSDKEKICCSTNACGQVFSHTEKNKIESLPHTMLTDGYNTEMWKDFKNLEENIF